MNILALDQATVTGWAISYDLYGEWDFSTRKDESEGMKFLRFKAKLAEVCALEKIDLVVYERPAGFHVNSVIHSAKLVAIIVTFCDENNINYRAYSASEIKKHATGKGNSGKEKMIASAETKFNKQNLSDNEADALWLLDLAQRDYK